MEYFITYGRVNIPDCKYGHPDSGQAQRKKSCFKRASCPDNVVCQKGFRGIRNLPANICPIQRCWGDRQTTCVTEFCPELSQNGQWRCPLKELPPKAKLVFEKKFATVLEGDEIFTLLSEEGLGLSTPERRIHHCYLLDKFRNLKKTYLEADYEAADFQYIPLMIECQRLAAEIRKEEVKYSKQEPTDAVNTEQPKTEKPRSMNDERDHRIYELALNENLTWRNIAETVGAEFNEPLSPDQVATAAKRYQQKHNKPLYPRRKPGRKS